MASDVRWWQQGVVFLLMLVQIGSHSSLAIAQTQLDSEPPLIEHEVDPLLQAGSLQYFEATVVDDVDLDTVKLFFRFDGDTTYTNQLMTRVSTSSSWRTVVEVDEDDPRALEYYIEASDRSGNRTFRGFTFNPLVRRVPAPAFAAPQENLAGQAESTTATASSDSGGRSVLYYVLGALAIGVVAGLAASAGGGSDDGEGSSDCPPSGCELTLTVQEPF